MLEEVVADGVQSGEFHAADSHLVVFAIMAVGGHLAGWYRPDGALSIEEIADGYAELFVRALRNGHGSSATSDLLLERTEIDRLLESSVGAAPVAVAATRDHVVPAPLRL
jgi:Tetracyclin repressor-like, C-terminal domain